MARKLIAALGVDDECWTGEGASVELAAAAALEARDASVWEWYPERTDDPEGEWDLFFRVLRAPGGAVTYRAYVRRA